MPLVLASIVALAALVAAIVLLTSRNSLRRELAAARADVRRLDDERTTALSERDQLRDKVEWLTSANARITEDADRQRRRAEELSVLLEAATADGPADDGLAGDGIDGAGLWELVLANVTRRWAAVVGVPPDRRSVAAGTPAEQLAEALTREIERLREEVGVDVELSAADPAPGNDGEGEAVDRVTVLVAALELLGALASTAQRVTVELADTLVLTGDGWLDPYREVTAAHGRATRAGVTLDPLEADDERVRLVIHHRPSVTAASSSRS